MAAVAEAELPVPEEVVGPTPRSKMRISISVRADDAQKFDVGLVRKVGMNADLRADFLPCLAGHGELRIVHHDDEMRIAGGDFNAGDCQCHRPA